ncbi:BirA family transcriptional regulator, biotin operon repressor / biotin-[acetyl-CoA-carboxylase] ligase [Meinhardsimonia xiamenensis]|jgi:BirA family biotin operon repressor/biotin-[acetyl-CoA-carboxylase] ligase|uniref:biotin--[biotin carboxyl-carrier protein] ligase n=1 Tax=Meinhardsimonia xiamenensis TaxID=990712 RepID=A0A1G9G4E3_9RHOB|nr:biotin--[acetyl-CoA-carboxylase] ligase [Meinhardsimonia xiamenensis]PRX32686.1 BirA family biotin operon repressor/biotin-[acetyl-CoA-carboxylase] ligase [Meinhardsimonia xiamenensis]SDK95486.1 BirA family transcriptional regulator, biotin operon repressor / biotin-[acetyl-CoA-carboxylase] ligase [Meinhardsimonia xiamenensis]
MTEAARLPVPPPWPHGVDKVVLPEVDSTMSEAARRAAVLDGPAWILAHRQTAARGRRGREWVEPAGNFAATWVGRPRIAATRAALLGFAAALALWEVCALLTRAPERLALKWPNDLLLDGAKLSGILLEAQSAGEQPEFLAVGIGVNLAAAPPVQALEEGALPAIALEPATGVRVTPEALLDHLAPAFAGWSARLEAEGFLPLREAWLARAAGVGQPAVARMPREELRGTIETLDEEGRLILATPKGRRAIAAADILF